jgi:glutamate-ammonia-ligase adenylyltransferase
MDYQAIDDMRSIKTRIDYEVERRGQKERDVKLGMGGIREVEFGLQILQLLYGGKRPSLRKGNSLEAMAQLVHADLLEKQVADALKDAYIFLRKVENLLQLEHERQTHILPSDLDKLLLLARRLGFSSREKFLMEHEKHKNVVQAFYQNVFSGLMDLKKDSARESSLLLLLEKGELSEEDGRILKSLGFKDADLALQNLLSFAKGGEEKISTEVFNDFMKIIPTLETAFKKSFNPDQGMTGLSRFVSAYKARSVFFKLLKEMPEITELLVMVFGMSPFLSEILIRNPELFDVIASGSLNVSGLDRERQQSLSEFLDRTQSFETNLLKLNEYKNLELLRLGARDIMGLAPCMETVHVLSLLAEFVLNKALKVSEKFFEETAKTPPPPFVIIGLGKFGGQELGYTSDLDMMFVSDGNVEQLEKANAFGSILMDALSKNRVGGYLYKIDPRLRPDGSKGPLVQSIETCQAYYAQSDSIWERMALSRARVIGGDDRLGEEVIKILERFVFKTVPTLEQTEEIRDLRERIFEERCSKLPEGFEVKSGIGGLLDIEFLAQFLQLKGEMKMRSIWESHTLKLLQKLSYQGLISQDDLALLVDAYLFYREVENTLRLVKDRPTDFIPRDSAWAEGIQKKMGLDPDSEHFFEKLTHFSHVVRYLYDHYVKA